MLERRFHLRARSTDVRTECIGGLTTFTTLSYIIFVQPAVLAAAGMDPGAVMTATCIASAAATLLMGLWADYPIAVAPAMGHNFYFAFMICGPLAAGGLGYSWPIALGANCLAGIAFLLLSLIGVRERLITAIPAPLQHAIAAGIGLFIALIGFEWAGLVRAAPGTLIALGDLRQPATALAVGGTLWTAALLARGYRSAILIGTIATGAVGVAAGLVPYAGVLAMPPSIVPTLARLDIRGALQPGLVGVVFVLFFLGLFDTVGTLVGVAEQAGLMQAGRLPRAREAMATDAIGTIVGTTLGTSTLTAFVESAAGVQAGARTGLCSVVTAVLFIAALWLAPLARMAGAAVRVHDATLYPVVAPALILVGSFMVRSAARIDFSDPPAALAAFLTMVTMPFAFSISDGIAFGCIGYVLFMSVSGRWREVDLLLYGFVGIFLLRYAVFR